MVTLEMLCAPLFLPAHRQDRLPKAMASRADAIILDLEDGVPLEAKVEARRSLEQNYGDIPMIVRVNPFGSPWHDGDVMAAREGAFAAVMLPKSERLTVIADLAAALGPSISLMPLIETARGVAEARSIARVPGVSRLVFGSLDFCADIGCAHSRNALLLARSELVLASRLAGLPAPLDGVTTNLHDSSLVEDDARYARELGMGGKLCIHPCQIPAVNRAFTPTETELHWAKCVLASGDGAVSVDGMMVDEPVRQKARAILKASSKLRCTE